MLVQEDLRLIVHPLDEPHIHVRNIIERLSHLSLEQRRNEGNPFRFAHTQKIRRIECEGFSCELMDFLIGNIGKDPIDCL